MRGHSLYRVLLLLLLIATTVFGISIGYFNSAPITFNYLAGEIEIPLIALIVGDFLLAVLLTLLVCLGRLLSLKNEIRRLRKQLAHSEVELKNLRNIPLKDV